MDNPPTPRFNPTREKEPIMEMTSIRAQVSDAQWQTRVWLAAAHRQVHEEGVQDLTYNHLSARVPDQPDTFLIKPEHQMFSQVTASSLMQLDFAGNKLSTNPGKISPATMIIHAGILEARKDLNAVFHTHSPANVGLSAQKCGLLPINQHALRVHWRTGYHDFHGWEFDMDARQKLIESLGDNLLLVLRNHGAIVCGHTIAEAVVEHHHFEFACRAQIAALSAGGVDQLLMPSKEVIAYATHQAQKYLSGVTEQGRDWIALMKHMRKTYPDFED